MGRKEQIFGSQMNCLLERAKKQKNVVELQEIKELPHVFDIFYEEQILKIRLSGAKHNLLRILHYLEEKDIAFGRVYSELPTLNDVFLEITGKELRD